VSLSLDHVSLDRTIFQLALPAVVENLLQTAVFFSDTVMIGWLKDPAALAAVGLAGTLMYLLTTLISALAVSATALVAQAWGARRTQDAGQVGAQAILLSLVFSVLVTVLLIPFIPTYLRLMGGEPAVIQKGTGYLRIVLAASVFSFPMMVANGVMRGAGDTRTPMWNTLAMNTWNIITSYVLIFGVGPFPSLALNGAAWGTATARTLGGFLAVGALLTGRTFLRLDWRQLRTWQQAITRRIVTLAIPTAIEAGVAQFGFLLFTRIVASLGTIALAAHQLALRVESLSYMPSWGLAVAATTLVGQALGAGDPELARRALRRTLVYSLVFNGILALAFVLFSRQIVLIFGSTSDVLALAAMALAIAAAELPGLGLEMILAGGMRGAGDTRTPMYVTLVGVLAFRLSVVYFLAVVLGWGLAGVWWGTAIDWTGRAAILWILFRRQEWQAVALET
jgi:putative MATE family efflux protein